eukprot:2890636-Rhodomonas_salina.9
MMSFACYGQRRAARSWLAANCACATGPNQGPDHVPRVGHDLLAGTSSLDMQLAKALLFVVGPHAKQRPDR